MTSLMTPLLWCVLQVTLVALLAAAVYPSCDVSPLLPQGACC
ncbi:MAG: hypothetical protein R3C02_20845 [Planctomycetaceae bacterium]